MTFTKLFSSITESTIWCEPSDTRIVWITMLAMADRKGRVFGSVPGLANRSQVPVQAVRDALQSFLSPDIDSRTKDHEGRRIEPLKDGAGWLLLNHAKYRQIRDDEERRAYKTEKQREYRGFVDTVDNNGYTLTVEDRSSPSKTGVELNGHNAEADAEAEKTKVFKKNARGTEEEFRGYAVERGLSASDGTWLFDKMLSTGWRNGGQPVRDWKAVVRTWQANDYFPSQKTSKKSGPSFIP